MSQYDRLNENGLTYFSSIIKTEGKKYIDDKFFYVPISSTPSTTVKWDELYQAYSDGKIVIAKIDYVQNGVVLSLTAPLYGVLGSATAGTFMFTFLMGTYSLSYMVTGTGSNVCTVTLQQQELEILSNKVQSVVSNSTSTTKYASTKAVFDEFQRKPVLIYDKTEKLHVSGTINSETDSANGLLNQNQGEGLNRDITSWNIENMDLSEFKHLRVVFRRSNATYGTTGEFNIPLDCDAVPTRNIYVSGATISAFNDRNRLNIITCAVDSAKTKFCVTQTFSLYGTGVTAVSDLFVEKIYGYYD